MPDDYQNFGFRPACLHSSLAVTRSSVRCLFTGMVLSSLVIDSVIAAFAENIKTVVFHVFDKITSFDRHSNLYRYLLKKSMPGGYFFTLLAVGHNHFPDGILKHCPAFFDCFALGHYFRPFNNLAHIA